MDKGPKLANLALWGEANAAFEGRAYRHPHTGEKYPSITTILKLVDKGALAQWAANLSIEWAVQNLDKLYGMSEEKGRNAGRYRWKDVRDERAMVGTGVHNQIEALQNGSWETFDLDDEQKRIMEQWYGLNQRHSIKPILNEFTVFDESGFMGTADAYAEIDGQLCLIDYKTSKNMWPEHEYQLAALWHAEHWLVETSDMVWEDQKPRKIDKVAIIHLREDKAEIHYIDNMESKWEIYNGYRQTWYAIENLKKLEKKQELAKYGGF